MFRLFWGLLSLLAAQLIVKLHYASRAHTALSEVFIQNYADYMPPELVEKFTAETGITIKHNVTPDADASMIEFQLLTHCTSQDIVLLSLYPQAQRLAALGLFATIPTPQHIPYSIKESEISIPNEGIFCMPYVLGTVSVAYNPEKVLEALGVIPDNPLDLVFDLETVRTLHKQGMRISVADSGIEVFGALALYLKGKTKQSDISIETRQQHLLALREFYDKISVLLYIHDIEQNNAEIVIGWSTFLREAVLKNPNFVIAQPPHCVAWVDVLVIPRNAPNYQNALKFIEFITRPEHIKLIQTRYFGNNKFETGMHHRWFTLKEHYQIQRWWQGFKMRIFKVRIFGSATSPTPIHNKV